LLNSGENINQAGDSMLPDDKRKGRGKPFSTGNAFEIKAGQLQRPH